jgi:transposase InsO family protein
MYIKNLRTNRGGEFLSLDFINFLTHNGINHQLTMARALQQNGVAERRNRTIIECARCMANASNCPGFLWPEVVNAANHLINLSPTKANSGIPPNQLYHGISPKVDHLRIFGSLCYLHFSF